MSESQSQLKLSFAQLLILLAMQVGLLAGAFYLGAHFGSGWTSAPSAAKSPQKDPGVASLFPQAQEAAPSEAKPENAGGPSNYATAFDKSPGTVFRIKSSENSAYTLQIASYPDEGAASQVVDHWKKKGYMAFLSVEDIPDKGKWYRVNVGNFGDEESASKFAKNIKEKENVEPQVVLSE